jgi:hypothetical protein
LRNVENVKIISPQKFKKEINKILKENIKWMNLQKIILICILGLTKKN